MSLDSRANPAAEVRVGNGRFILRSKVGNGSFGEICKGYDSLEQRDVAIKIEPSKTRHPQLLYEYKVYRLLHQGGREVVGIPRVYWSGLDDAYNVMVMDMCGPNLEDLFNYCLRKFTLKTVLMLAEQMLFRIEFVHRRGMLHRDIKPENFVMGLGDKSHHVYIIDFGLSKKYWFAKEHEHIPFREGKSLTGTARYCSTNTHRGFEQSRRDDLESIGYLLLYFFLGKLPWQGIDAADAAAKTVRIGEKKMATPLGELCRDCPDEFLEYMQYCRSLHFADPPDYDYLRGIFTALKHKEHMEFDWEFDWLTKRDTEWRTADSATVSRAEGAFGSFSTLRKSLPSDVGVSSMAVAQGTQDVPS